jgi:hypothetical protein
LISGAEIHIATGALGLPSAAGAGECFRPQRRAAHNRAGIGGFPR